MPRSMTRTATRAPAWSVSSRFAGLLRRSTPQSRPSWTKEKNHWWSAATARSWWERSPPRNGSDASGWSSWTASRLLWRRDIPFGRGSRYGSGVRDRQWSGRAGGPRRPAPDSGAGGRRGHGPPRRYRGRRPSRDSLGGREDPVGRSASDQTRGSREAGALCRREARGTGRALLVAL